MNLIPIFEDFDNMESHDEQFQKYLNEARNRPLDKSPNIEKLKKAIEKRQYCGIYYEDVDKTGQVLSGFRLIEPYTLGRGMMSAGEIKHSDRIYLSAFVIRNSDNDENYKKTGLLKRKSVSKSKTVPYWRLFRFDRIKDFTILPHVFSRYREGYNPSDSRLGDIMAGLEKSKFKGEISMNQI